ncbi:hypothetical protein Ait01nite_049550 [Actinoplanes italicus]|uniref:Surface-anchored protein n=1 Tax=Actinoplanes italicus TaxID=113567 RepID=A0A2T0KA95_9ACTN|nr:choice-of-anchor M domain-containing protein [Actinoplanes italicus]PRX20057.1 surface-anchored protein [Actinoplanes italicus]GIE31910.1 hypothetical protein Ait01nite_049550 [Actinoplanes italicus]
MLTRLALAAALIINPTPDQTLDANQGLATGRAVLETGHVDIGPRYRDGRWTIQIHDDHAVPAVWRDPADTVLRVRDTARQTVPGDPAYAFLGAAAGSEVHVVPQTERPGVVWIGWNTQDPGVLGAVGRGVTMTLRGVQGPGDVTVFLQSGNLGAPQVLWSSAKPFPQPIFVESNTHTHANWVFGAPGTYLVAVDISAELADGSAVGAARSCGSRSATPPIRRTPSAPRSISLCRPLRPRSLRDQKQDSIRATRSRLRSVSSWSRAWS